MNQTKGSYLHYLKIYFVHMDAPLFLHLREKDIRRFEGLIDDINARKDHGSFFWGDTVDGRSYAINPRMVQAIHVLMEPSLPEDEKYYEGPIKIRLTDRSEAIETRTEDPDQLCALYTSLQEGRPAMTRFVDYTDEDGEQLYINVSELVYIEAPTQILDRGHRIIVDEMNSELP